MRINHVEPLENDVLQYDKNWLEEIMRRNKLPKLRIMNLFGQTNRMTINRWLSGGDIYFFSLLKIVNSIPSADLLQCITYRGYHFQTTLEELYQQETEPQRTVARPYATDCDEPREATNSLHDDSSELEEYKFNYGLAKEVVESLRVQVASLKKENEMLKGMLSANVRNM